MKANTRHWVTSYVVVLVTTTLALVVLGLIFVLLYGLFDHRVDNTAVFDILSPAASTIIGAMIGILAGIRVRLTGEYPHLNHPLGTADEVSSDGPRDDEDLGGE